MSVRRLADELHRRFAKRPVEEKAEMDDAARFLTASPERAEDLYQALFLRLHRARDRYDPARPFAPWFLQIARRLLVADVRRAFRAHEVPIHDRDPQMEAPASEDRLADRERVAQLLQGLSPEERYVLVNAKVGGVGYPDLADDLGKSVVAVRKMASRAMQRLRRGAELPAAATSAS